MAKRGKSQARRSGANGTPGWVWLVVGVLLGAALSAGLLLKDRFTLGASGPRPDPNAAAPKPSEEPVAQRPSQPAKPKYDFYTLLPESEVIVPPDAVPPPPAAALTPEQLAKADAARAEAALNGQVPPALPTASSTPPAGTPTPPPSVAKAPLTTQFFLQAGSFRKQADADKVRAQIILLGQNVQVESGTVREEIWYRVLVGPFASREQLGAAQKQLAASGFGNLLLQQRQSR